MIWSGFSRYNKTKEVLIVSFTLPYVKRVSTHYYYSLFVIDDGGWGCCFELLWWWWRFFVYTNQVGGRFCFVICTSLNLRRAITFLAWSVFEFSLILLLLCSKGDLWHRFTWIVIGLLAFLLCVTVWSWGKLIYVSCDCGKCLLTQTALYWIERAKFHQWVFLDMKIGKYGSFSGRFVLCRICEYCILQSVRILAENIYDLVLT